MLEKAIAPMNDEIDHKTEAKKLQEEFSKLQIKLKEKRLPVIIVFEGWGASGKGTLIGSTIKMLDPRFFKVNSTLRATDEQKRYPLMKRFWDIIPEYGKLSVMDRSWYQELGLAKLEEEISDKEYNRRIEEVKTFERQLSDDGYLIIKFFLHISKQEQKKRFDALKEKNSTKWRVTANDKIRNKRYNEFYDQFNSMLEQTNTDYCPWTVIDSTDKQFARFKLFETLVGRISSALDKETVYPVFPSVNTLFDMQKTPLLSDVVLSDKFISDEEYADRLRSCQKKLEKLHGKLYQKKIPVVIAFEGWDAAGKGGAIKRVGSALDPRGYEAVPVAAPDSQEKNRHYLWRFWRNIPKNGHITIFDRSWYGRVMVERIEGFTPRERCDMAYREMNEFEQQLSDAGVVVMKFWVQIDKDEQLKRFTERMNTPEKQWKITDEDWRNREKWDVYEEAIDEMIQKTSTKTAPWTIVEGCDKKYARIKVLETIIARLEKALKK